MLLLTQYSVWLLCAGTAWYLLQRYWSKYVSKQLAHPKGAFGESAVPAMYKALNLSAIVWACDSLEKLIKPDTQVLDLACGSGLAFRPLLRRLDAAREAQDRARLQRPSSGGMKKCKIFGADISPVMLNVCKEEFKDEISAGLVELVEDDVVAMKVCGARQYDLVLGFNMIHLVKDKREAIKAWAALLNEGGTLAILFRCSSDYSREAEIQAGIKLGLAFPPSKKELMDLLLIDCGLQNVKITEREEVEEEEEEETKNDYFLITGQKGRSSSREYTHVDLEYSD